MIDNLALTMALILNVGLRFAILFIRVLWSISQRDSLSLSLCLIYSHEYYIKFNAISHTRMGAIWKDHTNRHIEFTL